MVRRAGWRSDEVGQGPAHRPGVELARQVGRGGDVVGAPGGGEAIEDPEPALAPGGRHLGGDAGRESGGGAAPRPWRPVRFGRSGRRLARQLGQGDAVEQARHGQRQAQLGLGRLGQLDRRQRVEPQRGQRPVGVDGLAGHAQHGRRPRPQPGEPCAFRGWKVDGARGKRGACA